MATWAIPAGEPSPKESFEDHYYQVKSERDGMTQRVNDLDDANRMLRTKCTQLETFKKKVVNGADAGLVTSSATDTFGRPKEIHEIQRDYQDLFACYGDLQRDHRAVVTRHKSSLQAIGKLKTEIQSLKLRYVSRLKTDNRANRARDKQAGGCRKALDADLRFTEPASNKENASDKENVKHALSRLHGIAEEELQSLRSNPHNCDGKSEVRLEIVYCSTSCVIILNRRHAASLRRSQPQSFTYCKPSTS